MSSTSREVAFQTIRDTFGSPPRAAQAAFDYRADQARLEPRDRAFAAELAYGTIKARRLLDWWLKPYIGDRQAAMPESIVEILRLGAYQLLCLDGVPAHAAVYETVALALRHGHRGTAGLVNAVLRRIQREHPAAPERPAFASDREFIAVSTSLPSWIVERYAGRFGEERLAALCRGLNGRPQHALTLDPRRRTVEQVLEALSARGVEAHVSPYVDGSIISEDAAALFAEERAGHGVMQSESAAMPVDLLAPCPGERVLELCAGRGNKTLQLAARMEGRGQLEAIELDPRKTERLGRRLAPHFAQPLIRSADATKLDEGEPADAVLVDAPCSGLGVLGRHPEARWRKDPADAERHAEMQLALLRSARGRVKSGGRLVYSVCSPDPCEGEAVVDRFLADEPDFERAAVPERYAVFTADAPAGDLVVPPGIDGRDGFFISVLTRR